MTMDQWLRFIRIAFSVIICAWLIAAMFLLLAKGRVNPDGMAWRTARWIFHEVKPFYRAMAVVRFGVHCFDLDQWLWIHAVVAGMDFWNYHLYKDVDDDDDRWQRRKQKVLDKITITDGRLAVIPA